MARTILHTVMPFKAGTDRSISDWHYITIEHDTAKAERLEPFRVVWHAVGMVMEKRFTHITDACAFLPEYVADMTKNHSTDGRFDGLKNARGGWPYEYNERDLRKRGAVNQIRADMGYTLQEALDLYNSDPAYRF